MASEIESVSPKPVRGFKRLHEEYIKLVKTRDNVPYYRQLHYREGASLTSSDFELMHIATDLKAYSDFWKPAGQKTRDALRDAVESALKKCSFDIESYLSDNFEHKERLAEYRLPTMGDAYDTSFEYIACLVQLVGDGILRNEALLDASGDYLFQDLSLCFLRSYICMETRKGFATSGYPHVTILSIQPQRARSQKDLLCTEIWTLYWWASKLASRALHSTNHCLPLRLVSLCGYEARIVSAVFSLGNLLSIVQKKGHGDFRIKKCQLHIEEYRDLSNAHIFWGLMEELIATPCGSINIEQLSPEQESTRKASV